MSRVRLAKPMLIAYLAWTGACGMVGSDETPSPPEPVAAGAYSDDPDGLRTFFEDMTQALANGDRARARTMARSLELEQPEVWFRQTFETELGEALYQDYKPVMGSFASMADTVQGIREKRQDRFVVERFESADDDGAVGFQSLALQRMKRQTPLYSVRAVDDEGETVFHLWSFVYQDGFFRWIGKTAKVAPDEPRSGEVDWREFRVRDAEAAKGALEGDGKGKGESEKGEGEGEGEGKGGKRGR